MNLYAYRLHVPLVFPEGLHPGAGSDGNAIVVARDGLGRPVLRGSAIAGVLRSAYYDLTKDKSEVEKWFGKALDGEAKQSVSSRLITEDAVLMKPGSGLPLTTHNAHNRHTGAVYEKALYSEERVPAGAKAGLFFAISADIECDQKATEEFLAILVGLLQNGLMFGGAVARGMGRAEVDSGKAIKWRKYEIETLEGRADWLDDGYTLRRGIGGSVDRWDSFEEVSPISSKVDLKVHFTLRLARGQDFLVAEGGDMMPLRRINADGKSQWVLPGSTLRGLFRAWFSRLAARDGYTLTDSAMDYQEGKAVKYDEIGWGGEKRKEWQESPDLIDDPILRLFGSLYARGRIHISDGLAIVRDESKQLHKRKHVAIDRFSGGANEGALFENHVLVGQRLVFPVTITVTVPRESEAQWLEKTLRAIDIGLIRIGSSKASGRLEIATLSASGKYSDMFASLVKGEE